MRAKWTDKNSLGKENIKISADQNRRTI